MTSRTTSATNGGSDAPLVSQRQTTAAPASAAAVTQRSAYSLSSRQASKKCSASYTTRLPCAPRKRTDSSIMRRFSSRLTRRTLLRCRPQVLPTMATVGVKISASTRRPSSACAGTPFRRVMPKATSSALASRSSRILRKNSISLGLEAGKPPSMKPMPSSSSLSAMRTFSSTETDMPSCCMPSRSVVSYSCTCCAFIGSSPRRAGAGGAAPSGLGYFLAYSMKWPNSSSRPSTMDVKRSCMRRVTGPGSPMRWSSTSRMGTISAAVPV